LEATVLKLFWLDLYTNIENRYLINDGVLALWEQVYQNDALGTAVQKTPCSQFC